MILIKSPSRWRGVFGLLAALACALVLGGCDRSSPRKTVKKPVIVVSVFPVANLVEQLTGEWAEIHVLLPDKGENPAGGLPAEATAMLGKADLLILGGTTDAWVEAKARTVARGDLRVWRFVEFVSAAPSTQPATRPADDDLIRTSSCPWMDLLLADRFVAVAARKFESMFPDRVTPLRNRALLLRTDILFLHQEYEYKFGRARNRKRAIVGDAADLMAKRYGLEVVAAGGAGAAGVPVVKLDPVGGPGVEGYSNYLEMMRSNLKALFEGQ